MGQVEIAYNHAGDYYAIAGIRECAIWLSVEKYPLPVPHDMHRPGTVVACIMRGRDYYRIGQFGPASQGPVIAATENQAELIDDYRDAVWWTPGLEEAWAELDGMHIAMCEAQGQIHKLTHAPQSNKDKREAQH